MKVLIIEDEIHAANVLIKMLNSIDNDIEVSRTLGSVEETIEYLIEKPQIDLIFMDIQLSDGISFEIFSEIKVEYPVIFTTSYDDYAIRAFQYNSVDYLLKPVEIADLQKSIDKFKKHFSTKLQGDKIEQMLSQVNYIQKQYKKRFLVKTLKGLLCLQTDEIAYFYIDKQSSLIKTQNNISYFFDKSLDELERILDPQKFFRLNRQIIVSINSIAGIQNHFNYALKVELNPAIDKEIIVSRYSVKSFKEWLDI